MKVFGLTGGIASGKSTVARRFEALGIPVVYADILAREAVAKGSSGFDAVVATFGPDVVGPDGDLDRKVLGERVFKDAELRGKLNAIVHPRVASLAMEKIAKLAAEGHAVACYEIPLLVENGLQEVFRPVVVVAASEELQVERAMARDAIDEAEARRRVRAQKPLSEKVAVADYVIENAGTLDDLVARTDEVAEKIRASL
jgi:dephospho-CoA kinase